MLVKTGYWLGLSKVSEVGEMKDLFSDQPGLKKFASAIPSFKRITLDPARYLYLRNHSVSAYEFFGPNDNGDGFPDEELKKSYSTFIGKRVTIDHRPDMIIGVVLDSRYVPQQYPNDPLSGHYIQNLLAIDKKLAAKYDKNLVNYIVNGEVTDTSMGSIVQYSICSICGKKASVESEYCEHIAVYKMKKIKTASGEEKLSFEICYGVDFFEDSIIRPLNLRGLAGGRGADRNAKMLEILTASFNKSAVEPLGDKFRNPQSQEYEKTPYDRIEIGKPQEEESSGETNILFPEDLSSIVKNRLKELKWKEQQLSEPTIIVSDRENLLTAVPDEELIEALKKLNIIRTSSFNYIYKLSNLGYTTEDSVKKYICMKTIKDETI